jgi:hypothetical protein
MFSQIIKNLNKLLKHPITTLARGKSSGFPMTKINNNHT